VNKYINKYTAPKKRSQEATRLCRSHQNKCVFSADGIVRGRCQSKLFISAGVPMPPRWSCLIVWEKIASLLPSYIPLTS